MLCYRNEFDRNEFCCGVIKGSPLATRHRGKLLDAVRQGGRGAVLQVARVMLFSDTERMQCACAAVWKLVQFICVGEGLCFPDAVSWEMLNPARACFRLPLRGSAEQYRDLSWAALL